MQDQALHTPCILDGTHFLVLMGIVVGALIIGWVYVFTIVRKNRESVSGLIAGTAFLQNLTVIGIVTAVGCLGVAGILKGELIATILSGIVGYVLGSVKMGKKPDEGTVAGIATAPDQPVTETENE